MEIRKNNGKVKMILTDDYLIIKKVFRDKKIKRSDIRSALLVENYLIIVTYDSKVFKVETTFANADYIRSLKLLIDEINKEDILIQTVPNSWFILAVVMLNLFNFFINSKYSSLPEAIFVSLMYVGIIIELLKSSIYMKVKMMYVIESKEFHSFENNGDIKRVFKRNEVTSGDNTGYFTKYKYKNKMGSFTLEKPQYPVACLNANCELEYATRNEK